MLQCNGTPTPLVSCAHHEEGRFDFSDVESFHGPEKGEVAAQESFPLGGERVFLSQCTALYLNWIMPVQSGRTDTSRDRLVEINSSQYMQPSSCAHYEPETCPEI